MVLEPATYTSEALLAQYLHGIQTVHILQLESAGTDSLLKYVFLQGNPILPNNLARQ
jgi:hypothetical protein